MDDLLNDFFNDSNIKSDSVIVESDEEKTIGFLIDYDFEYYSPGRTPLISDEEYDRLKEEAYCKYPNNSYFKEVGTTEQFSTSKVKHEFILGSLTKYKIDTVNKWLSKFNNNDEIIITPKYDGLTGYTHFIDNDIVLSSTRGNSFEGSDITDKVKKFIHTSNNVNNLKVRGEIVLPGNLFNEYSFSNRRNGASGILGRDDYTKELGTLDCVFYEIIESDKVFNTEEERLKYLNIVFPNNRLYYKKLKTSEITSDILIIILNEFKEILKDYCDIDGIVLTLNNSVRENEKYPKYKVAFKHGDEEKIGEISHISWEVSRNGRVVPVVNLKDAVILDGANLFKATAYNAKFVVDNDLKPGKKIKIVRSGGVIPKIVGVVSDED